MLLYLHKVSAENWLPKLKMPSVIVNETINFSEFIALNLHQIEQYTFLFVDVTILVNADGELDSFAIREYEGQAQLIICNQLNLKLDFLKQRGILVMASQEECKSFFAQKDLLLPPETKSHIQPAVEIQNTPSTTETKTTLPPAPKPAPPKPSNRIKPAAERKTEKKNRTLPKFELPKLEFPKLTTKSNKEEQNFIPNSRQEIGFIGAAKGVGTTFAAYFYAKKCAEARQPVSLVLSDGTEVNLLQKQNHANLEVFNYAEIRQALNNNIVVYDFGYLNREDEALISAFERCQKRYIVAALAFHKKHCVNNIVQYLNETTLDFTVLFNFISPEQLPALKKTFKEFTCDNLEFIANL